MFTQKAGATTPTSKSLSGRLLTNGWTDMTRTPMEMSAYRSQIRWYERQYRQYMGWDEMALAVRRNWVPVFNHGVRLRDRDTGYLPLASP